MNADQQIARRRIHPLPADLDSQQYDVAVIGAGINGCGIARDAAMRGLSVLLVDMGDIGAQTTAWSTRLIHGGLRYLEHLELKLVRESLRERQALLTIAPHLVEPLRFLVPIHAGQRRGPVTIRLGMIAYDVLSMRKALPRHRMLNRAQTLALEPGLSAGGLRGAAHYYDAQVTFPERLALENALSARQHGCDVATYMRVAALVPRDDGSMSLAMTDELEGCEVIASARVVVNATGPWVDTLASQAASGRLIGGTKGSHIVVDPFPGAPRCAVYAEATTDRRPFFVIPWNGRYLIGTTDSRFDGDATSAAATTEDVAYLLEQSTALFPESGLSRSAVLYSYAGVRPLPFQNAASESSITRRHSIVRHEPPFHMMLSIVGGKLTTYRELAERVTDEVVTISGLVARRSETAVTPLPGAGASSSQGARCDTTSGIHENVVDRLKRIYGARSDCVVGAAMEQRDATTLAGTNILTAEVAFAVEHEMAQTLEDVLMRRLMAGPVGLRDSSTVDAALAAIASGAGWDDQRCSAERQLLRRYETRFNAIENGAWSAGQ